MKTLTLITCLAVILSPFPGWSEATPGQNAPEAESSPAQTPEYEIPTVEVISQAPLLGTGIDADKVPNATRVLKSQDIGKNPGAPSLTKALNENVGSINLDSSVGNSAQPDLTFRGFLASPVVGVPQGFAVYQNGIRLNEAFGDTVNWDLVPDFAVESMNLTSSNPVYGLNALGGSAVIQTKTGFTDRGLSAEVAAGSFGRVSEITEYGTSRGNWAYYVGVSPSYDNGWRQDSYSRTDKLYTDLGFDDGHSSFHLDLTWVDNALGGAGPTPAWLLETDWRAGNTLPSIY